MDIDKKNRTVKKLKDYYDAENFILHLKKKLEIINNRIIKIRTSKFDNDMGNSREYILEKLLDDKTEIIKEINIKKLERDYMDSALNMLDINERKILVDIYCNKYSMRKVASIIGYSEPQIKRKKNKAIYNLSKFI